MLRALGLGDFLAGVPAYRALRRAFPEHRTVLAAPAALAPLLPRVDLHGRGPASHDLVAALAPRRLVVFGGETGGGYAGPEWRRDEHERSRWCRLLVESGIPADPGDLELRPPALTPPGAFVGATLVHPGAAAAARRWPADRFAALVAILALRGHRVVVTGGPGDDALVDRVRGTTGRAAGRTDLAELAALVASARLVVSGDTGIAHLASAFGRPSVTLFGPTPPGEWGPPAARRHRVLWPAPPGYRGDPHAAAVDPVLARIDVAAVLDAADRALAGAEGRPPAGPRVRRPTRVGAPPAAER
jgi:ADP-heptose:LPS heptosyltransferase